MPDKEVADLPSATLPLSGTELADVVQGGNSRKVAVSDLLGTGLANLDLTVSQLALQVADNTNVALYLGPAGNRVADSFDALTYADVAGATNLDSSVAGLLKPTTVGVYTTVNDATLGTDNTSGGSLNVRQQIATTAYVTSLDGDRLQLTFRPSVSTGMTLLNVYVGHKGASAPDFDGGQVRVTFGGGNTCVMAANTAVVSDQIPFAFDHTKDLIISFDTASFNERYTSSVAGQNQWTKAGTGEAALTTGSGYASGSGKASVVDKVEVRTALGAANNMTVRSASFTAAAAPTSMKALLRVKEIDAATAGTDYSLECSRDGGTTWSTMTLTEMFTSPSPTAAIRVVEAAATSVTGQPSGTAPRWRFKTLNNKNVELHDALLYWS